MMKKRNAPLFSFGVFREGLRRLRLVTVTLTVLFTLAFLLTPILAIIERMSAPDFSYGALSAVSCDAFAHHTPLLLAFILGAPLVAYTLFSHLTSRRESDFFHALPHTRICLFCSLGAAAAIALFLITFLPCLISAIFYALFSRFFYLSLANLFTFALGCFVGALSVCFACTLALSLTGTRFVSLAVASMILLLPRLIICMMNATLEALLPMVTPGHMAPFFESTASYVFGFFAYLLPFAYPTIPPEVHAYHMMPILYTLLLALVYFLLSALAYRARKSETAEHPAPGRRLHAVYRTAVSFFCSLFAAKLLFSSIMEGTLRENLPSLILSFLFALAVYCLYELLCTRSLKRLLRALPAFLFVLLLNAALLLSMGMIYQSRLAFTPDKEEIQSISILPAQGESGDGETIDYPIYIAEKLASVSLHDEDSRALAARALADCVKRFRACATVSDYVSHYREYSTDSDYERLDLRFRTKSGTHYRTVYMKKADAARLGEKLAESTHYQSALAALPKPQKNTLTLHWAGNTLAFHSEAAKEAFAVFEAEFKALSLEEKLRYLDTFYTEYGDGYFMYSITLGTKNVNLYINVTPSLFPRTQERILALLAEENLKEGTASALAGALSHKDAANAYELSFSVRDGAKVKFAQMKGADEIDAARKALASLAFRTPNEDESAVIVTAYLFNGERIGAHLGGSPITLVGCVKKAKLDEFLALIGYQESDGKPDAPLPIT